MHVKYMEIVLCAFYLIKENTFSLKNFHLDLISQEICKCNYIDFQNIYFQEYVQ